MKMNNSIKYTLALLAMFLLGNSSLCQAQILKGFGKKLEKKLEQRVERKADRHVDKTLDKADRKTDEPIDAALHNKKKKKNKKGQSEKVQEKDGGDLGALPPNTGNGMGEIELNYDFIPGERVLFETNFSGAVVGNFPPDLEFRGGELSVASYLGGRALAANSTRAFAIELPEKLPERFTIEFSLFNSKGGNKMRVEVVDGNFNPLGQHFVRLEGYERRTGVGAYKPGGITSLQEATIINEQTTPMRVVGDGTYVKVYEGTQRGANMRNADLARCSTKRFSLLYVDIG